MNEAKNFVSKHRIALGLTAGVGVSLVCLRRWWAGPKCNSKARLDGKHVLITGGNTGIGKETAMDLARRGAKVTLACRDLTRAEAAANDIRRKTGNHNILIRQLDLASLSSVRKFAAEVNEEEQQLDILINNAGIMRCPYWKTEDGFEMQIGTNHFGHFLLTNLLLDLLMKSVPSRIVTVSSLAHTRGKINFDDINSEKNYNAGMAYCQSKLANILFSSELAERFKGTGITTYSLHPGVINTELSRYAIKDSMVWKVLLVLLKPIMKTPVEGAQTTIYCAIDESLANESGKYYSDCAEKMPSKEALNKEDAKRLWVLSEKMVGLSS